MYLLVAVPFVLMTAWFSVYVLGASQGLIQANKAIDSFKKIKIKTGEWEITCIEIKGEKA